MKDFNETDNGGGTLLYRYENYKKVNNDTKTLFKTRLKSPAGIYLATVLAFITFWFLYSLIAGLCGGQPVNFILNFLPCVFAYIVVALILIFSVGGLWSKFIRFALRRRLVKQADRASLESQEEAFEAHENNSGKEKALYIYDDKVQFYAYGELKEMRISKIERVEIEKDRKRIEIYFFGTFGVELFSGLPVSELENFKSAIGGNIEINESVKEKEKREKRGKGYRYHDKPEISGDKIGGFIMGLISVGAGVAVICLHFYVEPKIPWFLGAFFLFGGFIVMCTTLSGFPIVSKFVIPLLFGIFFTVAPTGIAVIVTNAKGESLPINSLAEFLQGCTPLLLIASFLTAIGLLLIVVSVVQLIKYLKYDE